MQFQVQTINPILINNIHLKKRLFFLQPTNLQLQYIYIYIYIYDTSILQINIPKTQSSVDCCHNILLILLLMKINE
jgi:hypothetical protein